MPKSKPFIIFITGISCSGKTYLFDSLQKRSKYSSISFHDIDENGVPEVGRKHWRPYRVEELLHNAIREYKDGKSSVLCGISNPSEIFNFKYFTPSINVHFLLLDIPMNTYQTRIEERLKNSNEDIDHTELEIATKKLKQRLLNQVSSLRNGHVIKAGRMSKDEMVKKAEEIIDDLR